MENVKNKIVGIVSPPYEEAVDGGGIFKKGYVGNYPHSKNPDTVGNRTYSNKTHNFSDGQIGSLKSNQKEELDFDITKYHKCLSDLYWFGCYGGDGYFKQYFEPSTYAHPAKISPLLADKIFKHLEKLGILKEGMTILDFMAGSYRIPLLASLRGYKSIGVELEPHFTKMGYDNKKFAEQKIGRKLDMEIIQGDSRQLSKLLNKSDVAILSPPYGLGESIGHSGQPTQVVKDLNLQTRYGSSEGNIGNLPYVAVVSPPFFDSTLTKDKNFIKKVEEQKRGGSRFQGGSQEGYGDNPSNIGNLKYKEMVGVVSPPYQDAIVNFENDGGKKRVKRLKQAGFDRKNSGMIRSIETGIQIENPNNIGSQFQQNYISAMLQVYKEASKVCPIICTVTKNPTRAGKLRRLDLDTAKLLELVGYSIVDYHRALLFKTHKQPTLVGTTNVSYKGRLSFFKRLSLSKGNCASEWEDIIIAVRD